MVVITSVPESDEVMNQVASRKVDSAAIRVYSQLMSMIWFSQEVLPIPSMVP